MAPFERVVVRRPIEPPCPAAAFIGEAAGGTGCYCRITRDLIESRRDPSTLVAYCFSAEGYQRCPTWRGDRDEYLRSKTVRDLLDRSGDRTAGHPEDRERNAALASAHEAQERDRWHSNRERER